MDVVRCPLCRGNHHVLHEECVDYYEYCTCSLDGLEAFYCTSCQHSFEHTVDPKDLHQISYEQFVKDYEGSDFDDDDRFLDDLDGYNYKPGIYDQFGQGPLFTSTKSNATKIPQCKHDQTEVELPSGVKIYCSSNSSSREEAEDADYGLYADYCWRPIHRNEHIRWPDFNLPMDLDIALDQINEAYDRAKFYDEKVQIGCIGGHGRTGTILAVMVLLDTDGEMSPKACVSYARDNYCNKAVENDLQEWYVEYANWAWYAEEGTECPKEPERKSSTVTNKPKTIDELDFETIGGPFCSSLEHFEMLDKGYSRCQADTNCPTWERDMKAWAK